LIVLAIGDVVSYLEMCLEEGTSLQRGMNYRLHPTHSVMLMSVREGSPYADRVEEEGRILVYEGHDTPKSGTVSNPKLLDQPKETANGKLTANGLFYTAADDYKQGKRPPEQIRVYEKIREGIWVYNGVFSLVDAWQENNGGRQVFKFRLELKDEGLNLDDVSIELKHERMIPSHVKQEVWRRDQGQCVKCSSKTNLHFDHIIPYTKGGTSLDSQNIQLLCRVCNLKKRANIE
jgi:hypothetical protein